MYIKKLVRNNKVYYILNIYDKNQELWACKFINEKIAITLIEKCSIKLIEA